MTIKKTASAAILDARIEDGTLIKGAHRAVFNYTPRYGYLYVRSRAISSRCNDNYDMFPAEEIEKSYLTFIGKPVFVNHHNEDHRRARGVCLDAVLHRDRNPDGSPDTWAEVLMEIDAIKFPHLAKAILAKEVNRTSMGCDVQFSKCSACGNVATSPQEYCAHIPEKKGKRIATGKVASDGKRETKLIFEICSGLSFFENSLLVEQPADPTAYFLGEVEMGPGLESLAKVAAFHPASPTAMNEAYYVHENNETDGNDSGFTPGKGGIEVHDYPRAINELRSNWQIHDDNLADEWNPDKKRDSLRRREVGKLINALTEHHQKQSALVWDLIKEAADENEFANAAQEGEANDHVRSFQGRKVPDHGDRVAVYRDLSGAPKSGYPARGSWSIKRLSERGGRSPHVHAHTVGLHITEAEPIFDEAAREHFREQEKRGVHAYIGGRVHHYAEPLEPGHPPEGEGWRQVSYYPDISHFFMKDTRNKYHGSDEAAFRGGSMWARGNIKEGDDGPVPQSKFEQPRTGKIWAYIHEANLIGDDLDNDLRDRDPMYWERVASIRPPTTNWQRLAKLAKLNDDRPYETITPAKPVRDMTDDEKREHLDAVKSHAKSWMTRNPMHPQNIVDHWNAATPEEKENGMNWYEDAHHTSRMIAHATGTPEHAMAGLISNYSPQTHWATNVVTAAKAARLKMGLGGKGNKHGEPALEGRNQGKPKGIMASEGQRKIGEALVNAPHDEDEAMASGQHYEKLLKGPKTRAFARLIHSGGDDHSVVVDRHAFSVASGARASDAAYGFSGLGGKKKYAEAEGHYRAAAQMISEQEGRAVHPHQVQAATWLVRQRLNEEGDRQLLKKGARSASAARTAIRQMHHYMGEHHPEASLQMPGTGYSKETGLAKEDLSKTAAGQLCDHRLVSLSRGHLSCTLGEGHEGPHHDHYRGVSWDQNGHATDRKDLAYDASRHLAYGETKAPQDVDTLRAENCVVCGNSTAFDGVQCQVCGYVAPPRPFGDPDVDTAKDNDLRKQVLDSDDNVADPNDPTEQLGNQIGNPDELDEQAADAETEGTGATLTCTNCGTGIIPQPPQSEGGEPPYPAEGDVCPVCKQGELMAGSEDNAEEASDEDGDGIPDSDEEEGDSNGDSNPFAQNDKGEGDESDDEDSDDDSDEDDEDEDDSSKPVDKKKVK